MWVGGVHVHDCILGGVRMGGSTEMCFSRNVENDNFLSHMHTNRP